MTRCPTHPAGSPVDLSRPWDVDSECVNCRRLAEGGGVYLLPVPARPLPCVREEAVREWCTSTAGEVAEGRHVRGCELHERCTRVTRSAAVPGCDRCPDYDPGRKVVEFHLSAHGIGDAVVGIYAACGLAEAGHAAVFHCRHPAWVAGVSHPGVKIVPWAGDRGSDGNADYQGQLRAGGRNEGSRAGWYCDRIADAAGVPRFVPVRPQTVAPPGPVLEPGYVVLAPFSNWRNREWPAERWRELAARLASQGRRVVAVGAGGDGGGLGERFGSLPAGVRWWWGQSPEWTVACIAHADHFYGNDSGLAHVAGLHSVPATVMTAHLTAEFLFGPVAPTVRGVKPDGWGCSPCGWQGVRGWRRGCDGGCGALAGIEAGRVPLPVV